MSGELNSQLRSVLAGSSGFTARELTARLRALGITGIDKSAVNRALYSGRDSFRSDGSTPPKWCLSVGPPVEATVIAIPSAAVRVRVGNAPLLYPWQKDALTNWERQGRRGIVEAVTGAGKTMLGLVAVGAELERGGRALVLVPTIELQRQWHGKLADHLNPVRIGLLGDGHGDDLRSHQVLIAVVNSARDADVGLGFRGGLLIADECHRYGAERNAAALKEEFQHRLALTATVKRADDGDETWLEPYFGSRCFSLDYKRALRERVIAHFRVALVSVSLSEEELRTYEEFTENVKELKGKLLLHCGIPEEPFGEFMKQTTALSGAGAEAKPCRDWARGFLKAFSDRRKLLAETTAKLAALQGLHSAIVEADRTLVFTQTIQAAENVASVIGALGLSAGTVHSEHDRQERREVLDQFRAGRLKVVVAPQVLDEGIDVPEADLAIIVAASRTRRQMIQRMGRVLRKKSDGRAARFAILFARATSEDPDHGQREFRAHREFLEEIMDVADESRRFSASDAKELTAFLSPRRPSEPARGIQAPLKDH